MTPHDHLFADARAVADAVLFEGYVLYPYRASATKNRMRWQFGVLVPPSYADAHAEHSTSRTECLVDPREDDELRVELRFLHVHRRTVEALQANGFAAVDRLDAGDAVHTPWDEGGVEQVEVRMPLAQLLGAELRQSVHVGAQQSVEPLRTGDEAGIGRLVRTALPLQAELTMSATVLPGPFGALRLRVDVANLTPMVAEDVEREQALRSSLVAAHLLLGLTHGSFLSLAAPPEWAEPAAKDCTNEHTWPVLIGAADRARVVLSSPIILDDNPQLAPESSTVLYDSTEIDEILTLRTLTLTDEEKREARGTDPRAAALIDSVEGLPPELLDRLHGAIRSIRPIAVAPPEPEASAPLLPWWDPGSDDTVDPEHDTVEVAGVPVAKGDRVVLRPGVRGADAQDLFLVGHTATVQAVLRDVDGEVHVAVSIDGDALAEVQAAHGRYRYFRPDELEPVVSVP
jgi:hypothetical protein